MDFGPHILDPTPTSTLPPTSSLSPSSAQTNPLEEPREANAVFLSMIFLTLASMVLTGSTLQWAFSRSMFSMGLRNPRNTYIIIVLVAGTFSGIQAICNFLLYYYEPTEAWFLFMCLTQWVIMTHTSIMVVSNRLSMLYKSSQKVWKRLLLINVFMVPVSILVFVSRGGDNLSGSDTYTKMNRIIEPTQIALWGSIEFVLSGMFVVKMWAFKWTAMERKAILVLVLVGFCDLLTVFAKMLVGDFPATVVRAFAYCLRIRLEISVFCFIVDYWKAKSSSRVSGIVNPSSLDKTCILTSILRRPFSNSSMEPRSVRFSCSSDDDDSVRFRTVELDEDGTAKAAQIKPRDEVLKDDDVETCIDESLKESASPRS